MTEDQVRDKARTILNFYDSETSKSGVGQLTTFKELGISDSKYRPDGWYLPFDFSFPAIILETKQSNKKLESFKDELIRNCKVTQKKYKKVIGILYNGEDVLISKDNVFLEGETELRNKEYYLGLYEADTIDKQKIYALTKAINDSLHSDFGIQNLNHRMIFTACALVAKRYGAVLVEGMDYTTFHTSILSTLSKSLEDAKKQNIKLDILIEVFGQIKMNITNNQKAINKFIRNVGQISNNINSDFWRGEDVMAIFFNEFNRYRGKSEQGQVFTPDNITSLMYRLIDVNKNDVVLDAACGSGAFLVKAMCNMVKEAGGNSTEKAKNIKSKQLYGIEMDREVFALACANMLIHKDGKTNIEQMDSRSEDASRWIKTHPITKVLMNPPFETKYGCTKIVKNVLDSVKNDTLCAFIMPDKKLEKTKGAKKILKNHTLSKIIKLPEKTFPGVATSIFIFRAGIPQNNKTIFACYMEEDGLETVKLQGRQDIRNAWKKIEDDWVEITRKQTGSDTIQWLNPEKHLSYQMPQKEFELFEEDITKTITDFSLFNQNIKVKELNKMLSSKILYASKIGVKNGSITMTINNNRNDEN